MNNKTMTGHDTFFLARYAHNTLQPLVKAAQQYEPSTGFEVTMDFGHAESVYTKYQHLTIYIRANGQANHIMASGYGLTTKQDVDKVAAKVQAFIDAEQVKLEEAEDAKAEALAYEATRADADAAADADWDFLQERARERADIERDEDAHDIELQNIAAGN